MEEKSIVRKKRPCKRALIPNRNIPEKTCNVCGKAYKPNSNGQKTCSKECSHQNKLNKMHAWRENNPDYHKLREAKNIQRYYYKPNGYCKICGELIYQEYCGNRRTRKQMHDECVFADCLKAIGEKKALTSIQLQRLAARGYTKEEFVNEFIQTVR